MVLAAKARTAALLIILVWSAVDSQRYGWAHVVDLLQVGIFAVLGLLQILCARHRIGEPGLKYLFIAVDCCLLAVVFTVPNPFNDFPTPPAVAMDSSLFTYFFLFLMQATFSFRPSLVLWCGFWIVVARTGMLMWFVSLPQVYTNLDPAYRTAEAALAARADSNFLFLGFFATEMLACLTVTGGLAVVVWRSRKLVESRTVAELSRASLARYFSPNVVDRLSGAGGIPGTGREQNVAVLFADIVGFTSLCEKEPPAGVIALLRDYHGRLGQAVFDNGGTLDKYIGDGLMATFGTPEPGAQDAANALKCALDMIAALNKWNAERAERGAVPVSVGIGIHYGTVIAGDIGNESRLEYSVIGDTVNIASRLEQLTRTLGTPMAVSSVLVDEINKAGQSGRALSAGLEDFGEHRVKGRKAPVRIWGLPKQHSV